MSDLAASQVQGPQNGLWYVLPKLVMAERLLLESGLCPSTDILLTLQGSWLA